jgi:hypothetical protein
MKCILIDFIITIKNYLIANVNERYIILENIKCMLIVFIITIRYLFNSEC